MLLPAGVEIQNTDIRLASNNQAHILSGGGLTLKVNLFNINAKNKPEKNKEPKKGPFKGFPKLIKLSNEKINNWMTNHLGMKKICESSLCQAITSYKAKPSEASYTEVTQLAIIVLKFAVLFPKDKIDDSLVYKVNRKQFQKGTPLPLFIILTKPFFPARHVLKDKKSFYPTWDGIENFDWNEYMKTKLKIPAWTEAINVNSNQANTSWQDDLSSAIVAAGKLSYNPEINTLESLQTILLRLEARVKVTKTKDEDTFCTKIEKIATETFYSTERKSSEALLRRYAFLLTPPFITYEDKKAKLGPLKIQFKNNIDTGMRK